MSLSDKVVRARARHALKAGHALCCATPVLPCLQPKAIQGEVERLPVVEHLIAVVHQVALCACTTDQQQQRKCDRRRQPRALLLLIRSARLKNQYHACCQRL